MYHTPDFTTINIKQPPLCCYATCHQAVLTNGAGGQHMPHRHVVKTLLRVVPQESMHASGAHVVVLIPLRNITQREQLLQQINHRHDHANSLGSHKLRLRLLAQGLHALLKQPSVVLVTRTRTHTSVELVNKLQISRQTEE